MPVPDLEPVDVPAEPPVRRKPLSWGDLTGFAVRATDGWRWELGAGVSSGWRTLADLRFRKYGDDAAVSAGARLRFDLVDLTPRAAEVEIAARIGRGKLLLPTNILTRVYVMAEGSLGAARLGSRYPLLGGIGIGIRMIPNQAEWLLIDLGVRESYAPHLSATSFAARGAALSDELAWSFATEASLSVSILWPRAGRTCRPFSISGR
jgi:hypothetical protein